VFLVLARVNGFDRQEHYRTAIPDDAHLAGYLGAVENGSAFGMLNGDSGVGTSGGSEDHTAILLSTPGHVTCYGYHPVRVERRIALPPALTFVVAASGIAADKTGAARDKYNRASALVRELVRIAAEPDGTRRNLTHLRASRYGGQAEPDGTLADALDASPDAVERLRHAIARADSPFPADVLERRLDHFLVENRQILPAAIEALASGRLGTFGALVDRSQRAAEDLLGNQVPETITLARLARDLGAHAASSFGAGFGGSVWALVDAAGADEFADRWLAAYAEYHPDAALHAQAFVTRPGAAASPV
jgi:galactokinase